jgi:aspartyl/asparaginyl-tRNA synthetase
MIHFKILKKPEQAKFQILRWKEILKIRMESNEFENERHNKKDLWNEELVLGNKIGKPLVKLTKRKREEPN